MQPNPDAPPATHSEPADSGGPGLQPVSDTLHTALTDARRELDSLRAALDSAERRRSIERALLEADAIDLETATLLTEAAVAKAATSPTDADVTSAVTDLRRRKPFLFARRAPRSSSMAPKPANPNADRLALTREQATTGDRSALLRYLKLRRSA